jgi:hypothetical protein
MALRSQTRCPASNSSLQRSAQIRGPAVASWPLPAASCSPVRVGEQQPPNPIRPIKDSAAATALSRFALWPGQPCGPGRPGRAQPRALAPPASRYYRTHRGTVKVTAARTVTRVCQCSGLRLPRQTRTPSPLELRLPVAGARRVTDRHGTRRDSGSPGPDHQQSGQCIYITNMQNLNIALFYILFLEFAYYFAY